jgi:ribosomal protein S18 acetylase RimI-like enzyme
VTVRIRAGGRGDIPEVLALWERARAAVGSGPDTREAIERLVAHDGDSLLVAEDEEVVGAVIAAWDGFRGNIYRLCVAPARRREGIGRALVMAGHERLAAKGATRITALVVEDEQGAREFWHELGYERDPAVARYVRGG